MLTDYLQKEGDIRLSHIVVTHWHADHTGGVSDLLRTMNNNDECKIMKMRSDRDTIEWSYVNDGSEVKTEGATIKLLHSPGHTDDHMAVYLHEENALFSGDCVLGEGTAVFENLKQLLDSLKLFIGLKPDIIYPGHGPVVEKPIDKLQQYINHRLEREGQIVAVLREVGSNGATIEQIVKKMYTETPERLLRAAGANVFHHLDKLIQEQQVVAFDQPDGQYYRLVA